MFVFYLKKEKHISRLYIVVLQQCITEGDVELQIPLPLKGTVHPKIIIFLLPVVLLINLNSFGASSGDIGCRDFRLFSNIMGLNGALNVVLTMPKQYM